MMVQCKSFCALVIVLLFNPCCSAENVYCVTPTVSSCSSCPRNWTHCATLSEYAQEYFTSNTTMVFLLGDHVLDTNITVANVTRLTMQGEYSLNNITAIVRNGSVGFCFTNITGFNISSLGFTSYNRLWSNGSHPASISALFLQSIEYATLVNCSFHDNFGIPLAVKNTTMALAENNEFVHNQCEYGSSSGLRELGCGVTALNSTLTFTGNTTFFENLQTGNCSFYCAGAIWASGSSLHFSGINNFTRNRADSGSGGAIHVENDVSVTFIGNTSFIHNTAGFDGGAIDSYKNVILTFIGTNNFINNSAQRFGGAIRANSNTSLIFNGINNFTHNSAVYNSTHNSAGYGDGGVIDIYENGVLNFTGKSNFSNNLARQGGAIAAYFNSTVIFHGSISFSTNTAESHGGAMFLSIDSTLSIMPNTTAYWVNNHANLGGAIYVYNAITRIYCTEITRYIPKEDCFYQLTGQTLYNVSLVFKNNSADDAGSVLYGGAIDNCTLTGLDSNNSKDVFDILAQIEDDNTPSNISSDPFGICSCNSSNHTKCSKYTSIKLDVYPGETFQVSVVAVGQRNGTVSAAVRSRTSRDTKLLDSQYIQQTNKLCTLLNYTVFSQQNESQIEIYADGPCSTYGNTLVLKLHLNRKCPPGFNINQEEDACVCDQALQKYTNKCNISNELGHISRESDDKFWVGYDQSYGLTIHPHCPFDYCVNETVVFTLNTTLSDRQCAYNRSGILCGACTKGYSLVLGTSHCKCPCTNSHLALVIPFALMGVALVFLLLACKLTVATGTLSGLVFYANIIGVNRNIFLPVESPDALSVFIAWLNLDFGIETCFYNGMDAYSNTWLQFVFPVYILVLVGLIIHTSHVSRRFANLLGSNPVSVLATLILLSYTKILRTLIATVYFAKLSYRTHNKNVWLHDANIDYLTGKHIPLFIVAVLVFVFLFLPYTLLLLFGQWLQAISHLRLLSWVNRLKPFMDSYHAPYKAKHRYWPGLLLILRFVLLLGFASNCQQDPSINLLAIQMGAGILHLWAWISGGVYKNWCLDALEGSFALNLIVLGAATYHVNHSQGNQLAVGHISAFIAFLTFVGILAYHILQQLKCTKLGEKIFKLYKCNTKKSVKDLMNDRTELDHLREPLLDDMPQLGHSVL